MALDDESGVVRRRCARLVARRFGGALGIALAAIGLERHRRSGYRPQLPQLAALSPSAEVELAGFSGLHVDMSALPNPDYQGDVAADIPPGVQFLPVIERFFSTGFAWTTSSPEAHVRAIALQAGEHVLLMYLEAPAGSADGLLANAAAVLETMVLLDP